MRLSENPQCGYCGAPATEIEHVIARQFFAKSDHERKNNLPRIPTCRSCNSEKQTSEDMMGVILSIASPEESARAVFNERVGRTLNKNIKLKKMIRDNLHMSEDKYAIGVPLERTKSVVMFWDWLVRGLYFYELKKPMPLIYVPHIVNLIDKEPLKQLKKEMPLRENVQFRTYAGGDMKTYYSVSGDYFCWLIEFRRQKILMTNVLEKDTKLTESLISGTKYAVRR